MIVNRVSQVFLGLGGEDLSDDVMVPPIMLPLAPVVVWTFLVYVDVMELTLNVAVKEPTGSFTIAIPVFNQHTTFRNYEGFMAFFL